MNFDLDGDEIDGFLDCRDFSKKVLEYPGVVVVEFFATWCPPCSQFQQIKQHSLPMKKYRSYYNWYKIDIEKNLEFAKGFELEGVPTVLLYYQGAVIDRFVGLDLKGFARIKENAQKLSVAIQEFVTSSSSIPQTPEPNNNNINSNNNSESMYSEY